MPHPPRAPFAAANASISSLERFLLLQLSDKMVCGALTGGDEKSTDEATVFRELLGILLICSEDSPPEKAGRGSAVMQDNEGTFDEFVVVDHVAMSDLLRIHKLLYQTSHIKRETSTYSIKVSLN